MIEQLYGVKSHYNRSDAGSTVGVAVSTILKNNPNRLSFIFVNLSGNAIYISPNNDVSSSDGIYIAPNGGRAILQWDVDFELVSMEWFAIAAGAGSNYYLLENISL
jgi:hypothetical protein